VDHIFVNAAIQPVSLVVHRSLLARIASDHFPLMAEFAISPHRCPRIAGALLQQIYEPARRDSKPVFVLLELKSLRKSLTLSPSQQC
jgi:hypothetical protein